MPSWRLVAAWLLALTVTTAITWQAVSLADSQVSVAPVDVVAVSESATSTSTSSPSSPGSTTTSAPEGTTTATRPSTSTTTTENPTATQEEEWTVRTITTLGGTVIVRHRSDVVELQAATPLPGFEMEITDDGPDRVRVEFESEDDEVRVEARPTGEGLSVEIDD